MITWRMDLRRGSVHHGGVYRHASTTRKGGIYMKRKREQGIFFIITFYCNYVSSWLPVLQNVMYGTLVSGRIIVCFPQMNESFFSDYKHVCYF